MNALAQWNQLNELEDPQQSLGNLFSRSCVHWREQHLRVPQRVPLVAVSEDALAKSPCASSLPALASASFQRCA